MNLRSLKVGQKVQSGKSGFIYTIKEIKDRDGEIILIVEDPRGNPMWLLEQEFIENGWTKL
jgi:hypothetical protein